MWRRRCHHPRHSRRPFWVFVSMIRTVLPFEGGQEGRRLDLLSLSRSLSRDVDVAAVVDDRNGSVTTVEDDEGWSRQSRLRLSGLAYGLGLGRQDALK